MASQVRKLQLTLAILKPDVTAHPHRAQEIKDVILKNNFYFVRSRDMTLTQQRAQEFYKEHEGKFFFNRLVGYMSSGPLSAHVLARPDAIAHWRKMMGPTKVFRTIYQYPKSIRGDYGLTDTRNSSHGSDSEESARREANFYFPDFDLDAWYTEEEPVFRERLVYFDKKRCQHVITTEGEISKMSFTIADQRHILDSQLR